MTDGCVFCRIVAGEVEASVAYEDEHVIALMDIEPLQAGHTLVVTKRHIPDIYGLDETTAGALFAAAARVAGAVKEAFESGGITLWQANDAPWQDVFHLHVHVLPRFENDGLLQFRPPRTAPARSELDAQAARIRAALPGR